MRRIASIALLLSAALAASATPAFACPGSPDPCPYRALAQFGVTSGVVGFPQSVAAAPDGSVLVPDSFDYHVSRFAGTGAFVAGYGAPKLTSPPADGTTEGSTAVAVDPATGDYYVLDNGDNRVEEFAPDGTFLHRAGKADGASGSGVGQFDLDGATGTTGGIAVGGGFVYVADGGNARIQRLSLTLTGAAVMNGTSFAGNPTGIAVSGSVLWVTDHESSAADNRIIRYSISGTTLSSPTMVNEAFADALAYDPGSNSLYATPFGVDRFNATTLAAPSTIVPAGHGPGQTNEPLGVTVMANGDIVVTQGDDTIKRFTSTGAEVWHAGVNEHANGTLTGADGVSVAASGDVLVADQQTMRITRFASSGAFVSRFESSFEDPAGNYLPTSVAQAPDGTLWVGDLSGRVIHFDAGGGYLGDADGTISAVDVAVDGHGQVDVLTGASNLITRHDAAGNVTGSFGATGSGPGQMMNPQGLAAAPDGTIAIADSGNHRVDLFDANGTFLRSFGSMGSGPGQFQTLTGVAADGVGHVFALDSALDRVQEFGLDGTLIAMWGTTGTADGEFADPRSIAADVAGNVYVGDGDQHRVQEFVLAPLPPPPVVPPVSPPPTPKPKPPPAAKLKLTVSSTVHLSALLHHGLKLTLTSDRAGKATLTVALAAKDAKGLGLLTIARSTKPVTVSSAAATYAAARSRTITLTLTSRAKAKLAHLGAHQKLKLALVAAFTTSAHKSSSASKTVTLEH